MSMMLLSARDREPIFSPGDPKQVKVQWVDERLHVSLSHAASACALQPLGHCVVHLSLLWMLLRCSAFPLHYCCSHPEHCPHFGQVSHRPYHLHFRPILRISQRWPQADSTSRLSRAWSARLTSLACFTYTNLYNAHHTRPGKGSTGLNSPSHSRLVTQSIPVTHNR